MHRIHRSLIALVLSAPLLLCAATPKDTLVQAMAIDDIISMDPAESFEIAGGEMLGNTYERLVQFDVADPAQLSGELARRWTVSADGKTFTFELLPGIRFSSGNPLTAEDAAWSLQRAVVLNKSPAFILTQFGWTAGNVASQVKVTGPLTLSISTDRAYAPSFVLNCLSSIVASVVDKRLLQSHALGDDLGNTWLRRHDAGSGPFKLREWRAGEVLVLDRNDLFHGARPALLRVIYRHVKESATQRLLLQKGDIDVARNLSPQDLAAVSFDAGVKQTSVAKGTVNYISLNMKNPLLAKPEVREAFKWLVDYDAIGATLVKGIGVVNQNFLPQGQLGASSDKPYKLDVAKAKALLVKAGLPNGFKVTMEVRTVQPWQGIAEAVQQTAGRAGIDIEIIPGDGKQTLTKYRARKHDLYIGDWAVDYWDPNSNASAFVLNSDNSDGAQNQPLSWRNDWMSPELNKEVDAALQERDTSKRAQMYEHLQTEFRQQSPFVMLYQQQQVAALRRNVEGFRLGPTSDSTYDAPVIKR